MLTDSSDKMSTDSTDKMSTDSTDKMPTDSTDKMPTDSTDENQIHSKKIRRNKFNGQNQLKFSLATRLNILTGC